MSEPQQELRSEGWKTYLSLMEAKEAFPAREIREYLEDPAAHPEHWRMFFTGTGAMNHAPLVLRCIIEQACTYIWQEERNGIQYGVCTCEAMIPGILNVDWTLQEFWQQPGHFEFPDRGDVEPPWLEARDEDE